jgi:hypothetical protein
LSSNPQTLTRSRGLPMGRARDVKLPDASPTLLIMIDTEEEFDWSADFDRNNVGIKHLADLPALQALFEAADVKPTYIIDYPVAASDQGAAYFRQLSQTGKAEIGMQLHPWVTPPYDEVVNAVNSYCCNLPAALEVHKLQLLYDMIVDRIGIKPITFKSGRYGIAHDTPAHLRALGILIDTSIIPGYNLSADGGPDFSRYDTQPKWLDTSAGPLLEIPTTGGYIGALRRWGPQLMTLLHAPLGRALKLEPIAFRLNLIGRVRLSPEGYTLDELKQLTLALRQRGDSVFSFSLHSPSAGIGYTPYVRSAADRDRLFATVRAYIAWFRRDLGGVTSTPSTLLAQVSA